MSRQTVTRVDVADIFRAAADTRPSGYDDKSRVTMTTSRHNVLLYLVARGIPWALATLHVNYT